jgi:hypothetical protein
MHVGAGLAGGAHDLLCPVDRSVRILLDEFTGMGVGGYAALGRQAGDCHIFRGRQAWRITDHNADPKSAVTEIGLK